MPEAAAWANVGMVWYARCSKTGTPRSHNADAQICATFNTDPTSPVFVAWDGDTWASYEGESDIQVVSKWFIESLQSRPPPAKDPIVPVTESGVFSRAFFEQFKA